MLYVSLAADGPIMCVDSFEPLVVYVQNHANKVKQMFLESQSINQIQYIVRSQPNGNYSLQEEQCNDVIFFRNTISVNSQAKECRIDAFTNFH